MTRITELMRSDAFSEQRVRVIGGSSGIGLELSRGFRDLGAEVEALGSNPDKLRSAGADPLNHDIAFERLEVRDTQAVADYFAGQSRVDVVIINPAQKHLK